MDKEILSICRYMFIRLKLKIVSVYTYLHLDENNNLEYVSLIFDEKNEFAVNNIESIAIDVFKDKYVLSLIFNESFFAPDNLYKSEIFYKKNKLLKEIVKYFKK